MFVDPQSDQGRMPALITDKVPKGFDIVHAHGTDPKILENSMFRGLIRCTAEAQILSALTGTPIITMCA